LTAETGAGRRNGRRRKGQAAKPAVSNNAKRRTAELERAVEAAEVALARIEDELADPACWTTPERSAQSTARHEAAKRRVEQLYEELVALTG
jgi:ATP-binding cassette, subfamily F, member 3